MVALLLCVAFAGNPPEELLRDSVTIIELNHYTGRDGSGVPFDQILYIDWSPKDCAYIIRDWRLLKFTSQIPIKIGDKLVARWRDPKSHQKLREVECLIFRESTTDFDPASQYANYAKLKQPARKLEDIKCEMLLEYMLQTFYLIIH